MYIVEIQVVHCLSGPACDNRSLTYFVFALFSYSVLVYANSVPNLKSFENIFLLVCSVYFVLCLYYSKYRAKVEISLNFFKKILRFFSKYLIISNKKIPVLTSSFSPPFGISRDRAYIYYYAKVYVYLGVSHWR